MKKLMKKRGNLLDFNLKDNSLVDIRDIEEIDMEDNATEIEIKMGFFDTFFEQRRYEQIPATAWAVVIYTYSSAPIVINVKTKAICIKLYRELMRIKSKVEPRNNHHNVNINYDYDCGF